MPRKSPEPLGRAPLAYENPAFLNSPDGRIIRILSEYSEPLARFRRERIQDTVVFFGSARFRGRRGDSGFPMPAASSSCSTTPARCSPLRKTSSPPAIPRSPEGDNQRAAPPPRRSRRRNGPLLRRRPPPGPACSPTGPKAPIPRRHRFVVTSGGGPGIMEAANRGAYEAGGKTIGLNIRLPFEQRPTPTSLPRSTSSSTTSSCASCGLPISPKALVVFPGGFGTLDEMFEILTLAQTQKLAKKITVVIYGSEYWKKVFNLDVLVDTGAISPNDMISSSSPTPPSRPSRCSARAWSGTISPPKTAARRRIGCSRYRAYTKLKAG